MIVERIEITPAELDAQIERANWSNAEIRNFIDPTGSAHQCKVIPLDQVFGPHREIIVFHGSVGDPIPTDDFAFACNIDKTLADANVFPLSWFQVSNDQNRHEGTSKS